MVKQFSLIFFLLIATVSTAIASSLTATVDRQQLFSNEHIVLTLRLHNSDTRLRAEGVDPNVDLTLLASNFDLGAPTTSHHFNIYRGQGRSTSELRVELFPKQPGKLTIPEFHVDGQRSTAIEITVLAPAHDHIPLAETRFVIEKEQYWQGEEIVVALELYHRVKLKQARLGSEPETKGQSYFAMEGRKLPQQTLKRQYKGFEYEVERIAWSLLPYDHGELVISLPDIWIVTVNDEKIRLPRQEKTITVKPLPADIPKQILVGKPELQLHTPQTELTSGEFYTFEVEISAPTRIRHLPAQLPELDLAFAPHYDPANTYLQDKFDGVIAGARFAITLQAPHQKTLTFPKLDFPYFDPDTGKLALASLSARDFPVQPKLSLANHQETLSSKEDTTNTGINYWQISTLLVTICWIASTLLIWRHFQNKDAAPVTTATAPVKTPELSYPEHNNPLKQKLAQALGDPNFERALSNIERKHGEQTALRKAIEAINQLCYSKHTPQPAQKIETLVTTAVRSLDQLKQSTKPSPPQNPWAPESFTPSVQGDNNER